MMSGITAIWECADPGRWSAQSTGTRGPASRTALAQEPVIPNTLYDHFQKSYGVTVARGSERLTATAADPRQAQRLDVAAGAPLLRLDRVMYELRQQPVEWRVSYCRTDAATYLVELR